MVFPQTVVENYRVVITRYGNGEFEETIPLGSWCKGGGLAGSKGHVYDYDKDWAGVWLVGRESAAKAAALMRDFPSIVPMQNGDGECTFRVPMTDLKALLPHLKAKRRFKTSEARMAAIQKLQVAGKAHQFKADHGEQRPVGEQG